MNLGVLAVSVVIVAGLFVLHYRALRSAKARAFDEGRSSSTYGQGYQDGAALTRQQMDAEIERRVGKLAQELERTKAERDEAENELINAFHRGVSEAHTDGRATISA